MRSSANSAPSGFLMLRRPLSVSASRSFHKRGSAVAQADAAGMRLVEAGDAVEHRGLAGAVRADQRRDLALARLEGQIIDGEETAEAHRQMLDAAAKYRRAPPSSQYLS